MDQYQPKQWQKGEKFTAAGANRMENAIGELNALALADPSTPGTGGPAFGDPVGQQADIWVPVFGDDFDKPITVLDEDNGFIQFGSSGPRWKTWYAGEGDGDGHTNNGAKGLGYYQTDQVEQSGSSAKLMAHYVPNASRPNNPYLCGLLQSVDFTPIHGYFEARVRVSGVQGTWPAVWLTAVDTWPPEIDILEQYGENLDNKITTWQNDVPAQTGSYNGQYINTKPAGTWMVVACEWDADKIVFYYDGVEVGRETVRANVPDRPMYLMLDMQIDADQQGIDPAEYPTFFEVDYYRAWQKVEETETYLDVDFSALPTGAIPSSFTVTGSGTVGVTNGQGLKVTNPGGAWTSGPNIFASGMPEILDFDVHMKFQFDSMSQHYISLYTRSDGDGTETYQVTLMPFSGNYEVTRSYADDQLGDSIAVPAHDWGTTPVLQNVRIRNFGGTLQTKVWPDSVSEPKEWEVDVTLGLDKSKPVYIDPGKFDIQFLNGPDGTGHTYTIKSLKITKAVNPEPVELEIIDGASYVTHDELVPYATKTYVNDKIAAIPVPDIDLGPKLETPAFTTFNPWFSALELIRQNTRDTKLLIVGDSTSQGYGNTNPDAWPARFRKRLARDFNTKPGLALPDTIVNGGNKWTLGGWGVGDGPGGGALQSAAKTGTAATYTPGGNYNTVDIWTLRGTGQGSVVVTAFGTTTTVNAASGTGWTKQTITGTANANAISIALPTTGPVTMVVDAYMTTIVGVRVGNIAVSGSTADTWAGARSLPMISAWAPDFTVIMLGINDALAGTSVADYTADMQALITEAKKTGDVLLMSVVPSDPTLSGGFVIEQEGLYRDALRSLAQSNAVGFFDLFAEIGARTDALYVDGVHPNATLHLQIARWMDEIFRQL